MKVKTVLAGLLLSSQTSAATLTQSVSDPSSIALMGLGLIGLAFARRRKI